MSKIENKKKPKRIAFRVLVAAAVIAMLTLSAFAAEEIFGAGDWFRGILSAQLAEDQVRAEKEGVTIRETLSESQIKVVNDLGKVFEAQTQTSEGTTVTMHAAYGDAYILHLYFRVEAPEGTVLPDGILYDFCDHNAIDYSDPDHFQMLKPEKNAPYDAISYSMDIEILPDEDPADNKKDFHVTIHGQSGTKAKFNDGISKYFSMTGIYQQIPDVNMDEDGYVQLAPGNFSFDIGMANEVQTIKLDADGFAYGGEKIRIWTHNSPCIESCEEELTGETDPETGLPTHSETYNYEVQVDNVSISPLSADWQVKYTCDNAQMSFGLDFRVVMKDGTSPITYLASATDRVPAENDGVGLSVGTTYFTIPIDLEEIDYILIGDEELGETCKLYLPE